MKLLAIDPSKRNLGFAIFVDGNLATVGETSFHHCDTLTDFLTAYVEWFTSKLVDVDVIAYEESRPRNMAHSKLHYGMIAIMHLHAGSRTVTPVGWSTAKKVLTGNGHASKDDMLTAARERYPMMEVSSHDMADAIGVGLAVLESETE